MMEYQSTRVRKVPSCEEMAIEDGYLKKDGTLNKKGYRAMKDLLESECKGKFENIYGSYLESCL